MPVDRGTSDTELGGDLRDGVTAFAGLIEFVVHRPGQLNLPRAELGSLTTGATSSAGGARPSRVRSLIRACSNSAMEPRIWKNIRPSAVEVSIF